MDGTGETGHQPHSSIVFQCAWLNSRVLSTGQSEIRTETKRVAQTKDDLVKDLEEIDPHEDGQDSLIGLSAETTVLRSASVP